MMLSRLLINFFFVLAAVGMADGQTNRKPVPTPDPSIGSSSATAAFAEVALKRAELQADLESLLVDYTEDFPKVKELRFGLARINGEVERLKTMKATDRDRATSALGKLMVRKADAEVELWKLQQAYADEHPEVRRAKRKVEIFESAIKEILG